MDRLAVLSAALVSQGLAVRLPTAGLSMYPAIASGDRITVSGLEGEEPSPGEILLVARGGRLWCHRLVRTGSVEGCRVYWTRGDANAAADEPVTASQIVGRVQRVDRQRVPVARRALLLIRPVPLARLLHASLGLWRKVLGGVGRGFETRVERRAGAFRP